MAHNPTNRHKIAAPAESEPNVKRQLHPSTTTKTSTVYNLTNHFSKLKPQPEKFPKYPQTKLTHTHLQPKNLSKSAVLGQGKRVVLESEKEGKKHEEESKNELVLNKVMKNKEVVRRKSLNEVKVELGNFLLSNSAKVVSADMPPFIQIHAIGFARKVKDSLEKFTSKALALSLKKEFDGVYGPAWHCIVGSSFGSFVTHSVGGFLYFQLDQKLYVLLFKTTVQRAD